MLKKYTLQMLKKITYRTNTLTLVGHDIIIHSTELVGHAHELHVELQMLCGSNFCVFAVCMLASLSTLE